MNHTAMFYFNYFSTVLVICREHLKQSRAENPHHFFRKLYFLISKENMRSKEIRVTLINTVHRVKLKGKFVKVGPAQGCGPKGCVFIPAAISPPR